MGIELVQVVEGPKHVAGVIHDDDTAATDHGSGRRQRGSVHHEIEEGHLLVDHLAILALDLHLEDFTGAKDLGGASSGNDRLELAAGLHATANIIDEFAKGDTAGGNLVGPGTDHVAGDAHDTGTTVAGGAHLGVFVGADL